MEKKLPGVFANKIEKNFNNNEKVFCSFNTNNVNDRNSNLNIEKKVDNKNYKNALNINQKINNIFNSPRYVYKAEVDITTKEGLITRKIIGQNSTHLITIDNELIPISDIKDIDFTNIKKA